MSRRRTRSSAPEPLPIQAVKEEEEPRRNRQLVTAAFGRFGLPDGWCVEEIPRRFTTSRPTRVDRYFIEPDTGQRFRSLVAVRRYLKGGQVDTQVTPDKQATENTDDYVGQLQRLRFLSPISERGSTSLSPHSVMETIHIDNRQMQIPPQSRCSSSFVLPDGWKIEQKPRNNTMSSHSDKYYIEPGTGRRFRSLVAVERYLTEENEQTPLQALISANKLILSSESSGQRKKIRSIKFVSKNSHTNECSGTINASRLNTDSSLSSGSSGQQKKIRSLKFVSKNLSHTYKCNSTLNASRLNTYSSLSSGSSCQQKKIRSIKIVSKNCSHMNESNSTLNASRLNTYSSHSSGFSGQQNKIRSMKIGSKNSSHKNKCNSTLNASRLNTYSSPAEHVSSPKKEFPPENSRPWQLNISSPPTKVKWVLVGRGGNKWNPFVDDTMVADSVKQKWSEIFKSTIYGENIKAPLF